MCERQYRHLTKGIAQNHRFGRTITQANTDVLKGRILCFWRRLEPLQAVFFARLAQRKIFLEIIAAEQNRSG